MSDGTRILFVITTLDMGGAEKHLLWLTRGLLLRGFDVVGWAGCSVGSEELQTIKP